MNGADLLDRVTFLARAQGRIDVALEVNLAEQARLRGEIAGLRTASLDEEPRGVVRYAVGDREEYEQGMEEITNGTN